jgi:CHASE2 domain
MTPRRSWFGCLLALACFTAAAAESRFAAIFITPETERRYGAFPLNRALIAQGVDRLTASGAKGVALKFFYDLPKAPAADDALAKAMSRLPTLLEARLLDSETNSNVLPDRFFRPDLKTEGLNLLTGRHGWIPRPLFSAQARAVGFVDLSDTQRAPLVEVYQGRCVPSLWLICLELAFDTRATQPKSGRFVLAGRSIPIDAAGCISIRFPQTDALDSLTFHDLLAGTVERRRVEGKVVIVGYDGNKIHTLDTPIGPMTAHRHFAHALFDLERRLDESAK